MIVSQKTSAPMSANVKKGFYYLLVPLINVVASTATLPIMTRWLSPEDFGLLALGSVVGVVFMGLVNLGVSTGAERNFFQYEADDRLTRELIHSALFFITCGTLCWGVVFYVGKGMVSQTMTGNDRWGLLIWVVSVTSAVALMGNMLLVVLRNQGRAQAFMFYSLLGILGDRLLTITFVVWGGGVLGAAVGSVCGDILVTVTLWWRLCHGIRLRVNMKMIREMLGIGLPTLPRTLFSLVENSVDKLMTSWLYSLGQVGIFGMANSIRNSQWSALTSIEGVYIPGVYRPMFQKQDDGGKQIGKFLTPYFYVSILLSLGVVLFIREVLWLLVTSPFYDVQYVVVPLAVAAAQMFFGKIIGAQFIYMKKTWYSTPLGIVNLVAHVGFAVILIPHYGAVGAAFSQLGCGILILALSLWVAHRLYPITYELQFIWPMMLLLYVGMGWSLLPKFYSLPYVVIFCGKLLIFIFALILGMRWWSPLRLQLTSFIRERCFRSAYCASR